MSILFPRWIGYVRRACWLLGLESDLARRAFLQASHWSRVGVLGPFRFGWNRGTTLTVCFVVLLNGKTAHTFPGSTPIDVRQLFQFFQGLRILTVVTNAEVSGADGVGPQDVGASAKPRP